MSDYKPVKIKRKRRSDPKFIRMMVFRIIPIALVVVISICGFTLFDKKNKRGYRKTENGATCPQRDD